MVRNVKDIESQKMYFLAVPVLYYYIKIKACSNYMVSAVNRTRCGPLLWYCSTSFFSVNLIVLPLLWFKKRVHCVGQCPHSNSTTVVFCSQGASHGAEISWWKNCITFYEKDKALSVLSRFSVTLCSFIFFHDPYSHSHH